MNEWCLSCSCTFSTGCKKALRDTPKKKKRRHSIVKFNRKERLKRDLIAILKKLNESVRQQRYYERNKERKLTAANERNKRKRELAV